MPDDIADMTVMRIVVRNGVSMDLVELLLDDIETAITYLDSLSAPLPAAHTSAFHH